MTTIADALRELADRFDRTPVRDLPPLWLQVSLQSVVATFAPGAGRTVYPRDARRDAVDTLAAHLGLPAPDGEPKSSYGSADRVSRVYVNVYTGNREEQP